jgi:hypothetical protein
MTIKYDQDKPRWDLLPYDALEEVVKCYTMGAKKYADENWKTVSPQSRYFAAAMRHLSAWKSGNKTDNESGLNHLAHAIFNLLCLLWFDLRKTTEIVELCPDCLENKTCHKEKCMSWVMAHERGQI